MFQEVIAMSTRLKQAIVQKERSPVGLKLAFYPLSPMLQRRARRALKSIMNQTFIP